MEELGRASVGPTAAIAQPNVETKERFKSPRHYLCYRVQRDDSLTIDGKLDEPSWKAAPWSADFVDIEGDVKPKPRFRTRMKMLWDNRYLYVAAQLDEPHVWGTLTVRDSVIFHDNDFEVFMDPDGDNHNYGEFEINALNTGWDLRLPRPYKDGGKADDGWDIDGLKTAVHVEGTLNDSSDEDRFWSIEIAIPFAMTRDLVNSLLPVRPADREGSVLRGYKPAIPADPVRSPGPTANELPSRGHAPRPGQQWRINFSRVQWQHTVDKGGYAKVAGRREDNWVWSPQGVINMHRPETWGYVQFCRQAAGEPDGKSVRCKFRPDAGGMAKHLLHRIYYAQRAYREKHGRFADRLEHLKLGDAGNNDDNFAPQLTILPDGYLASVDVKLPDDGVDRWFIRDDSLVWRQSIKNP